MRNHIAQIDGAHKSMAQKKNKNVTRIEAEVTGKKSIAWEFSSLWELFYDHHGDLSAKDWYDIWYDEEPTMISRLISF
jgi:hypothetical protein